jgi:hypothetical protein
MRVEKNINETKVGTQNIYNFRSKYLRMFITSVPFINNAFGTRWITVNHFHGHLHIDFRLFSRLQIISWQIITKSIRNGFRICGPDCSKHRESTSEY